MMSADDYFEFVFPLCACEEGSIACCLCSKFALFVGEKIKREAGKKHLLLYLSAKDVKMKPPIVCLEWKTSASLRSIF